jgi:hypothetical protein
MKILLIALVVLAGCKANHQHDGLYIADQQITGVTQAWILEGDKMTIYSMGAIKALRCKQYADRIETEKDETYYLNTGGGSIVVPMVGGKQVNMKKVSNRTTYNIGELDKLVEDAVPSTFVR